MDLSNKMFLIFCFLMSLVHAGPHTPPKTARFFSTRIIGGEEAPTGFATYMMALVIGDRVKSLMCGASILNSRVTLTAAHCVDSLLQFSGQLPESLRGVHSSNEWQSTDKAVEFQSHKRHPQYDPWNIKYDIAVMTTKSDIKFTELVQPIELNFDWVGGGQPAYMTGWGLIGLTEENDVISIVSVPDKLQMLRVETISPEACVEAVKEAAGDPDYGLRVDPLVEICTLHSIGHGACMGDSGSAVVSEKTGTQIGVVSWGFPCALGAPDVMVRVSSMSDFLTPCLEEDFA